MAERIAAGIFFLFMALQCAFILYMLGVYLYAPKTPHSWWEFVDEAARREAQSRVRSFRVIGPQHGRWQDIGFTTTDPFDARADGTYRSRWPVSGEQGDTA